MPVMSAQAIVPTTGISLQPQPQPTIERPSAAQPTEAVAKEGFSPPVRPTAAANLQSGGPETAKLPAVQIAEPVSRLGTEAAKRMAAYRSGANKLLKARIEATRVRLDLEPDNSYSIELFATDNSDPARVERFLRRARELVSLDDVYVLPQSSGGKYRIRVTYGGYPDRNAAAEAVDRLPPKYRQAFQTELRSFAELRASL